MPNEPESDVSLEWMIVRTA